MKRKLLVSAILIFIGGAAVAQNYFRDGFVVLLTGDTLRGKVAFRSDVRNTESCLFKTGENTKEYLPYDISGYGFDKDKTYTSRVVLGSFVQILVLGELSLYKDREGYTAVKNDETVSLAPTRNATTAFERPVVTRDKWRGLLAYLIGDCLKNTGSTVARVKLD